jgi:hypothetical protein
MKPIMMTPIEWLEQVLISEPYSEEHFKDNAKFWDIAKQLERQQLEQAYFDGTNFETNGFGNNPSEYVKQLKN